MADKVNEQTTDSVNTVTVTTLGIAPAQAMATLYQTSSAAAAMALQNAVHAQNNQYALANAVMLMVTWYYHISNPYGPEFLTPEGIEFLKANLQYLTAAGQANLLPDGGTTFLSLVQMKAETNSLFWAGATALFAAYGGAHYSLDRLMRKEI